MIHGSGAILQERRDLLPLSRIDVEGDVDLAIRVVGGGALAESSDPETAVWIEGAQNLLEHVLTGIRGDTLVLRCATQVRLDPRPTIEVRIARLDELEAAGSGQIVIEGLGTGQHAGRTLSVSIAGSVDVRASGQLERLRLRQAGSGTLDFAAVDALVVDHQSLGSGDASVHAQDEVTTVISGSGDLRIHGPALRIVESVLGSGDVARSTEVRLRPTPPAAPQWPR